MAIQDNPYQPPTTEVPFSAAASVTDGPQLATRGSRLAAAMLDGFAILAIMAPIQWAAGVFDDYTAYSQDKLAQVLWGLGSLVIILAVNGYPLATRAQTLGKIAMRIKIVTMDGKNADFARIVLRRLLPTTALSIVPGLGPLLSVADSLAIFRKDQRCLHDQIAGTRVVRA
jgi:uncharacterized RDD family membrane protein YckC